MGGLQFPFEKVDDLFYSFTRISEFKQAKNIIHVVSGGSTSFFSSKYKNYTVISALKTIFKL
jgi:hypothetical protein